MPLRNVPVYRPRGDVGPGRRRPLADSGVLTGKRARPFPGTADGAVYLAVVQAQALGGMRELAERLVIASLNGAVCRPEQPFVAVAFLLGGEPAC